MSLRKKLTAGAVVGGFVAYKSLQSLLGIPEDSTPIPPEASKPRSSVVAFHALPSKTLDEVIVQSSVGSAVSSEPVSSTDDSKEPSFGVGKHFINLYYDGSAKDFALFLRDNWDSLKANDSTYFDSEELDRLGSIKSYLSVHGKELSLKAFAMLLAFDKDIDKERFYLLKGKLDGSLISYGHLQFDTVSGKWKKEDDDGVFQNYDFRDESTLENSVVRRYMAIDEANWPENGGVNSRLLFDEYVSLTREILEWEFSDYLSSNTSDKRPSNSIVGEVIRCIGKIKQFSSYTADDGFRFVSQLDEGSLFDVGIKREAVGYLFAPFKKAKTEWESKEENAGRPFPEQRNYDLFKDLNERIEERYAELNAK